LRDRAILEIFYSTGIRRAELCNLLLHDVDPARGTVMVREGKGRKDRMVPIGGRALSWLARRYVDAAGIPRGHGG
jgi:integrase/recombinase XerD